ncbi:MAG: phosphotransferase [Kordiimonadaceae bacterium]|nr:phosphotransferase [Kordiimonadaceae bacterium]
MSGSRLEQQLEFCNRHGWGAADLFPLPSDASFRTYTRLIEGDRRAMLMDAPPEHENLPAYLKFASHLAGLGLRAPEVFAQDIEAGFALIEDFGTDTFTQLLKADAGAEKDLYLKATDVLVALHSAEGATDVDAQPYGEKQLLAEARLFTNWFVPAVRGSEATDVEAATFEAAWQVALEHVAHDASAFVLRDYHVDNLMIIKGGTGLASCGLLDFQDALLGSPAYDMVSLLEDARRDVSPSTKSAVIARYYAGMPGINRVQFETDMAILGAQRHAKVLGIFTRLSRRDDKHIYLKHIPRVAKLLQQCLRAPALAGLKHVVEQLVPEYAQAEITALGHI